MIAEGPHATARGHVAEQLREALLFEGAGGDPATVAKRVRVVAEARAHGDAEDLRAAAFDLALAAAEWAAALDLSALGSAQGECCGA